MQVNVHLNTPDPGRVNTTHEFSVGTRQNFILQGPLAEFL